jgi:hypothetical protein
LLPAPSVTEFCGFDAPDGDSFVRLASPDRLATPVENRQVNAIRRMLELVATYRAAWLRWREGDRSVVFPLGTYALRIHAAVRCADAAPL